MRERHRFLREEREAKQDREDKKWAAIVAKIREPKPVQPDGAVQPDQPPVASETPAPIAPAAALQEVPAPEPLKTQPTPEETESEKALAWARDYLRKTEGMYVRRPEQ